MPDPQPTPTTNPGPLAGVLLFLGTIVAVILTAAIPVLPDLALACVFVGACGVAWVAKRRWG